jgi:hypothetical protein
MPLKGKPNSRRYVFNLSTPIRTAIEPALRRGTIVAASGLTRHSGTVKFTHHFKAFAFLNLSRRIPR